MKFNKRYFSIAGFTALTIIGLNSCKKKFLEPQPYGRYAPELLQSKKGIEGLLVGTYGLIDGSNPVYFVIVKRFCT